VLIIPLATLLYGFKSAFQVVENNINESSIFVLKNGIAKIDEEIKALQGISLQMSQSANLKDFGGKTVVNSDYAKQALGVMEEYNNSLRYQGIKLIKNNYVYFNARDIVIYENSLYRVDIFERYIKLWNMELEEWNAMCGNENSRKPRFFVTKEGGLNYIVPFAKELRGDNLGALVYEINKSAIRNYLNFLDEYKIYSMFILNSDKQLIYKEDKLDYVENLSEEWYNGSGIINIENESITYISADNGWQYILVLPKQVALKQLNSLESFVTVLIVSAITVGLLISVYLSLHQGRPLNTLLTMITSSNTQVKQEVSFQSMGEVVTEILRNNETLLEELEYDKPYLKKAFFHNLIKAEFVNTAELNYMAKKAGIELTGENYCVVSFKLFANNDFYEVDEQTLEEVRIISQLVMNYLNERYKEPAWFYKRNTLVTFGIFTIKENTANLQELLQQTFEWLVEEYNVETNWGISNVCKNLLDIWKNCEEAAIAMQACRDKRHIMEYSYGLENTEEFYFPYIVEEKMVTGMKSGDWTAVEGMLKILAEENFAHRHLDRSRFIKFHRRMTELLSWQDASLNYNQDKIYWLNEAVINYDGEYTEYFERLTNVCQEICSVVQQNRSKHRKQIISEIMEYIKDNYNDAGLGLSKVGVEFGMSEGYLSTIFKEGAGMNFTDFLEQIRIDTACEMLKNPDNTVCKVAESVGYNSIQSFRRAFKRAMGLSPKEFRA
jgi:AraC-like DNA-binding protein/predicted NAD-dependent protein-ADP-ribosyltransferase YbiA (DUF1768 family)